MSIRRVLSVFAAVALLGSGCAFAQGSGGSNLYVEGGYMSMRITMPTYSDTAPSMYRLTLGMNLHPNVAVEEVMAFNARSDRVTYGATTTTLKMKAVTGFYVKPRYDLAENVSVFARVGYARYSVNLDASPFSVSHDGMSYGFGLSYKINKDMSANFDYMSYAKKDGFNIRGTTLGVGYAF